MKRLISCGLLLLMSSVTAPAVRAKTMAVNLTGLNNTETSRSQLTPFNLVGLAYQGYFKDQGIPGYQALISAYQFKQINTRLLVKAAVSTGMVSESTLTNRGYLSAVRADLRSMSRDDRGR